MRMDYVSLIKNIVVCFIVYKVAVQFYTSKFGKREFTGVILYTIIDILYLMITNSILGEYADLLDAIVLVGILMCALMIMFEKDIFLNLSIAIFSYSIYLLIWFIAAIFISFINVFIKFSNSNTVDLLLIVVAVPILFIVSKIIKRSNVYDLLNKPIVRAFIIACGAITFIASRAVAIGYKTLKVEVFFVFFVLIALIGLAAAVIWLINYNNQKKEREKIEAENERMEKDVFKLASKLHKSKEIYPALASELEQLKEEIESADNSELTKRIDDLVGEVGQLYQDQKEANKEDRMAKIFNSTGVKLLDGQLENYFAEADRKGIDFDVLVSSPIKEAMAEHSMKQTEVHTLVGDLIRNAFRSIERRGGETGRIFFCCGYVPGGFYEIDVYDDGDEFSLDVLKNFGTRGVTTNGTGNGVADTLDTIRKYGASFHLVEYRPGTDEHTKCISIMFDGMKEISIESYRCRLLEALEMPGEVLIMESVT